MWDLMTPGGLLDELMEDWHCQISADIDEITPQCPLSLHSKLTPVHTGVVVNEAERQTDGVGALMRKL